jgi:hypothetical protein
MGEAPQPSGATPTNFDLFNNSRQASDLERF